MLQHIHQSYLPALKLPLATQQEAGRLAIMNVPNTLYSDNIHILLTQILPIKFHKKIYISTNIKYLQKVQA